MIRRLLGLAIRAVAATVLIAISADAQNTRAKISGIVYDSIHRVPLATAIVVATPDASVRDTAFHSVQSDSRGRFAFDDLEPGSYTLSVEHPFSDSTGIVARTLRLDVSPGITQAVLALPSVATLRRIFCPAAVNDTLLGVMLGTIRQLNGRPAPRATVVFTWNDFDLDRATLTTRSKQVGASVTSDSNGVYRACGLPRGNSLMVQAQVDSIRQSGVLEEQISEIGVLLRDFTVSRVAAADSALAATGTDSNTLPHERTHFFAGKIIGQNGETIRSAQVTLLGSGKSAATDASGQFRIVGAPGGTQGVEVLALGYTPTYRRAEISDVMSPFVVLMEKSAVVLDSMRVFARRTYLRNNPFYREFEDRTKHTTGHWYDEDAIREFRPFVTSDVFRRVPGVHLKHIPGSFGHGILVSNRGTSTILGNRDCPVSIYINGMRMMQEDIDLIPPEGVHGIEVFNVSEVPPKYGSHPCGAALIWTK